MSKRSYAEKLKDPRWQKLRLEVLNRDNWTCTNCSSKENNLQVHHLKYCGEPWETPPEFLTTLCEKCHDARSEIDKMLIDEIRCIPDEFFCFEFDGQHYHSVGRIDRMACAILGLLENLSVSIAHGDKLTNISGCSHICGMLHSVSDSLKNTMEHYSFLSHMEWEKNQPPETNGEPSRKEEP